MWKRISNGNYVMVEAAVYTVDEKWRRHLAQGGGRSTSNLGGEVQRRRQRHAVAGRSHRCRS